MFLIINHYVLFLHEYIKLDNLNMIYHINMYNHDHPHQHAYVASFLIKNYLYHLLYCLFHEIYLC